MELRAIPEYGNASTRVFSPSIAGEDLDIVIRDLRPIATDWFQATAWSHSVRCALALDIRFQGDWIAIR